jgi:hypothetical protein
MARAFQFDVGPVVEQLNRILQMELAAIGASARGKFDVPSSSIGSSRQPARCE